LKARFEMADKSQDFSALVRLIHAAYEVLRNDETRKAYDAALAIEAARADVELKADLDAQAPRRVRRVQDVPHPLNAAFSTLAA
jgi:DnaJ-class molecular chaperone